MIPRLLPMSVEPLELHGEVLRCNPEAFECGAASPLKEQVSGSVIPEMSELAGDFYVVFRKIKVKKKAGDGVSAVSDSAEIQGAIIGGFCEFLEDLCSKAELLNSVVSSSVLSALEFIHAVLAVMAHTEMPKPLIKKRLSLSINYLPWLMFPLCQMMTMKITILNLVQQTRSGVLARLQNCGIQHQANKKRRTSKTSKLWNPASSKVSTAVNTIFQKLCTVVGLLKDLLLIERLSDSCILQLVEEANSNEVDLYAVPYVLVLHALTCGSYSLFTSLKPFPISCCFAVISEESDTDYMILNPLCYVTAFKAFKRVDSRMVEQLLESIIFIIDAVLPLIRKLPQSIIEELEQDLKQMIVRHSFLTVVLACIR
ncbi:hypothetical protein K1719_009771 [Acacia pycnantha]|nr:hypothetical protein K1719_009771 [Acacia pycnantha]